MSSLQGLLVGYCWVLRRIALTSVRGGVSVENLSFLEVSAWICSANLECYTYRHSHNKGFVCLFVGGGGA